VRRAAALLLALLLLGAGDEVTDLNDRARAALDGGRPAEAVQLLQKAVALQPGEPILVRNLAWALFQRGQLAAQAHRSGDALADFQQAGRLNPDEPGYASHAGQLLLRQYRLDEAEDLLRAALARHPGHADGWLLLGDTLALADQLPEAVEAYDRAAAQGEGRLAEIARAASARTAREHAVEKDYRLDRTPYFDILGPVDTQGPQFGTRLAAVLERARAEVCAALAVHPQHRATVVLYPPEAFRAATGTHEWVGGLFDRKIRLPIADVERDAPEIEAAFRHEFTHLVVSELSASCPTFVNEGLAQVMEHGRGKGLARLVAWLDSRPGGRAALPRLADLPETFVEIDDADAVTQAYLLSHAFVDHVVALNGTGPVLAWVRALESQPLAEAWQAAFGRPLAAQEDMFREQVRTAR
jgi:tetratricopeptide (TPR) repeat protein